MKNLRENRGITLVALIVTIIILLILAGVTIALLNGENGILSKTEKAATSYGVESIKEVVNLKLANLNASKWIDEGRKAVLTDLNELDDENSENFDAEITLKNPVQNLDTSAILIYDKHEVEVNSSLNIAKVDGEKQGESSGGTNEGSCSTEGGGNSSSIDSAEYAKLQETITQLQKKVSGA